MERVRKAHSHSQASLTESVNSSLRLADSRAMITCWGGGEGEWRGFGGGGGGGGG